MDGLNLWGIAIIIPGSSFPYFTADLSLAILHLFKPGVHQPLASMHLVYKNCFCADCHMHVCQLRYIAIFVFITV